MKRWIAALAITAVATLTQGSLESAKAYIAPFEDDGCRITLLWVNNYSDGSYTVTSGWECTGFGMVCQTRYDKYGNELGETCREV